MPYIMINNQSLHYLDRGNGPVLLFGHSYLWDCAMWEQQIAKFSEQYRCIVPDLWGHGRSSPSNKTHSIASLADDHWALMQALNIKGFSVIGLSVGGMWATQLALDHPDKVEKLVIMDSFVGAEPPDTLQSYLQILETVEQANVMPEPLIKQLLPTFLSHITLEHQPAIAAAFAKSLEALPSENIPTIVALGRGIFNREDIMALLPNLHMPTLILVGEFDKPRPPHEAKQMAEFITSSQCKIVANAGHISALEQPKEVNKLISDFLQG